MAKKAVDDLELVGLDVELRRLVRRARRQRRGTEGGPAQWQDWSGTTDEAFGLVDQIAGTPALGLDGISARCRRVILIKPQFEVGRQHIGKGGLVADETAIAGAVLTVIQFMAEQGWTHGLSLPSPIAGGDGNREVVALFRRGEQS